MHFAYRLLPYEREFLSRELTSFGAKVHARSETGDWTVGRLNLRKAVRLTYAVSVEYPGSPSVYTRQGQREDAENHRRQNTRYGPHSLHEYKGKFHPQTPRSLILQHVWEDGLPILDPFAGTGTTLVEARGLGLPSEGVEINPLVAMIGQARLAWEEPPVSEVPSVRDIGASAQVEWPSETRAYLDKWFPNPTVITLRRALRVCETLAPGDALVARAVLSNLLRRYSWQDPRDLRIRRRVAIPKMPPLSSAFSDALLDEWERRRAWVNSGFAPPRVSATLTVGDSRRLRFTRGDGQVAGTVTSPPYACALPYVDTYRLSLVALGLAPPNRVGPLEYSTTGGRDIAKEDVDDFESRLAGLPSETRSVVSGIADRVRRDTSAGFRRRAVPYALARYLWQIHEVLQELRRIEGRAAPNLWVVGPNVTTLLGERIPIPTPSMIAEIASTVGFRQIELRGLNAFHRYGLHSKNAIRRETLVSFYG